MKDSSSLERSTDQDKDVGKHGKHFAFSHKLDVSLEQTVAEMDHLPTSKRRKTKGAHSWCKHHASKAKKEKYKKRTESESINLSSDGTSPPYNSSLVQLNARCVVNTGLDRQNDIFEQKLENEANVTPSIVQADSDAKEDNHEVFFTGQINIQKPPGKSSREFSSEHLLDKNEDIEEHLIVKKDAELPKMKLSPNRTAQGYSGRKLLILDLNGLLIDVVASPPSGCIPDKKVNRMSVFKRPSCGDFLKFCFEKFEVAIWSSRRKNNLDAIVDFLMGDLKHKLLFCWDQSKCTGTGFKTVENRHKPLFLKELKKVWDKEEPDLPWENGFYSPSNTLLLDDSPYKSLRNPPHTAVFPHPYTFTDGNDKCLGAGGNIRRFLEQLAEASDVPTYVQEHPFGQSPITAESPSWEYYLKVIQNP